MPVWSRNGKWVAYSRTARSSGRQRGIYRTLANGSGGEEPLFAGGASTWVSDWTLNDEAIVFVQDSGLTNTRRDLWLLPLNGGAARPLLQTKADEYEAAISPDGRWIAYTSTSDEGNGSAVYVAPFFSMTPPLQVATAGGYSPRWNPNANGRELFFVGLDSWLYSAKLRPRADALERGGTTRLFPLYLKSIFQGVAYDVSGDGQRFLINTPAENPNRPLVLIQNWTADVKK